MSIFKKQKREANTTKEVENEVVSILPEQMPCTYTEFVSQEYNATVKPIEQEIKKLESRQYKLQDLFAKEYEAGRSNNSEISNAMLNTRKELEKKRVELAKAQIDNRVDGTAIGLALKLDKLNERKALYMLYGDVEKQLLELCKSLAKVSTLTYSCRVTSTILGAIPALNAMHNNLEHDLMWNIKYPDYGALRAELNERLSVLQKEREEKERVKNAIKREMEAS